MSCELLKLMKKVNLNEMVHTKQRDQTEICVNNKLAEI